MTQRFDLRTTLTCAGAMLLGACASTNTIDPGDLPPEATVDDGIDYYSADLTSADPGAEELLNYGNNQWAADEEGNRIYLLNRVRRGQTASYYVGDIRYLYANDNAEGLRGTGYGSAPVYVSRSGAPLQSQTYRGGRDNTYYQTRRGRIAYLPNGSRPVASGAPNDGQSNTPGNTTPGTSGPAQSTPSTSAPRPRPASTPARPTPPRTVPRAEPPRSQPQPRTRPADEARRPDR